MALKEAIAGLFGVRSYEHEYQNARHELEQLKHAYEITQKSNDILADKIVELEDRVELLSTTPEKYIWDHCRAFEKTHTEDMEHRAFANGRAAAYGELGIWRLDAIARGNCLVRLSNEDDAEIVELITDDLVDVYEETHSERVSRRVVLETALEPKIDPVAGEIVIDDLTEIGA